MFREPMDLRVLLLVFPFNDMALYGKDAFRELLQAAHDPERYAAAFDSFKRHVLFPALNKVHQIHQLDEIELLIGSYFPREAMKRYDDVSGLYLAYLSQLSRMFITHRDGKITFKYWENGYDAKLLGPYKGINKAALWHSLNRVFTTDLLAYMHLLDNGMEDERYLRGFHSIIHMEDAQLDQVLAEGVAETHMHLNAARSFAMNWQALMNPSSANLAELSNPILAQRVEGKFVLSMASARLLLGYYLVHGAGERRMSDIDAFYQSGNKEQDRCRRFLHQLADGQSTHEAQKGYTFFKDLLNRFGLGPRVEDGEELAAQVRRDPLSRLLPESHSIEDLLLFRCLGYMKQYPEDRLFSAVFWQYIRVKNAVFRLQVQGNYIRGLDYFQPFYKRATKLRLAGSAYHEIKYVLQAQLDNRYLRKLEVRVAPPLDAGSSEELTKGLTSGLLDFFAAYRDIAEELHARGEPVADIGIVYHFLKRKDEQGSDKCWLAYSEFGEDASLYFKRLQNRYFMQMEAIRDLREKIPALSYYIVGIDAASVEKNTEPWVFAPLFAVARDSADHRMLYLQGERERRTQHLGYTYHVGEDFRHFLTGLRHVDEVVERFRFRSGDRIGHGAVLGIKPSQWRVRNQVVILPRIEHLENLLWIWGLYKSGSNARISLDYSHLEQEILDLAKDIYVVMDGITVYQLWLAYESKFKRIMERASFGRHQRTAAEAGRENRLFCKFVHPLDGEVWNEDKLMHAQHCKCYLDRMLEPIQVAVKQEQVALLEELQQIVVRKISNRGIVVETNPSSNTAITEVEHIFEHYIQQLNQRFVFRDGDCETGVMVSINTDDPIVFNTNINNEFAFVFYALIEKGYARQDVLQWMDAVRANGLRSSFIQRRELSHEQRMEEIGDMMEALRQNLEEY
ncbi:hypothetical protein ACFFSY_00530 [Paenibacillus aurantiacus]|uniref:adenosine deaminase n=1 Tax=Paenibacillus aurantiacus TaxID=1936118 RepID=A0ABV5KGR7_9BACL